VEGLGKFTVFQGTVWDLIRRGLPVLQMPIGRVILGAGGVRAVILVFLFGMPASA
jgi:hypothetical protein